MTKRRGDREVHKETEEKPGLLRSWLLYFLEMHGGVCGICFSMHDHIGTSSSLKQPAHEKIGVVDSQWIVHQTVPSLGNQGQAENGKAPWQGVRERCKKEWTMFRVRMTNAEKTYYKEMGINPTNSTAD
eukprot:XP_010663659.1 PREDICTED: uncharacterized protein LOC100250849 [Vitis vinifera]